jgi:HlyD family secretion protein
LKRGIVVFNKYVLPLLAVAGLGFAVYTVVQARQSPPAAKPLIPPPASPKFRAIAGAGLIEARMENIPIGTVVPGVVTDVYVKIREEGPTFVKAGDPLFKIDDRAARAELKVREATLAAARADLARIEAAPKDGDIPVARAAVEEAASRLGDARNEYDRRARLRQQNAVTASELDQARFAYDAARAALSRAEAELARMEKTWEKDKQIARASVAQAESQVEAARTELDRLTVRALVDGEVLQVNVRPGQFAALAWREPLIVLGDVSHLHVRVDIDEQDVPHYRPGARAVATLKGRPQVRFDLRFVKVEPYVIPKRSLTGDNAERVDTRVLQVIYALPDDRPIPLYVGQQMDVYLEAATPPEGVRLESDPNAPKPFEDEPARPSGGAGPRAN